MDTAQFVDTLYSWSAFNTEEIGRIIGTGLNDLCNDAYPVENIHLIGNALGFKWNEIIIQNFIFFLW